MSELPGVTGLVPSFDQKSQSGLIARDETESLFRVRRDYRVTSGWGQAECEIGGRRSVEVDVSPKGREMLTSCRSTSMRRGVQSFSESTIPSSRAIPFGERSRCSLSLRFVSNERTDFALDF